MKTLEEFIQRLQEDAAFEKQAQAFDNGDDLLAFVRGEGYDFTLEQLMDEFQRGAELTAEAGGMAPAPMAGSASRPDDPAFSPQPEDSPGGEKSAALGKSWSDDSTREPPGQKSAEPQTALPPQVSEEDSPTGLFGGGGGRHRGFSPERLKPSTGEDS